MRQHRLTLAAAVAAATLLGACGSDPSAADDRAPATPADQAGTTSTSAAADALTEDVLLTDDDTVYNEGADWFRTATGDEDLDGNGDLAHPCLAEGLSGTGATEVVRADFELRNTEDDVEVDGDHLTQLVGRYDDAAAARAAYDEVAALVSECTDRPEAITDFRTLTSRDVATGDAAQIIDAHFGPVPEGIDEGESAYIMETGLAVEGDRLTMVTSIIVGLDYNFLEEDGGTPVNQMLPKAVDRLG